MAFDTSYLDHISYTPVENTYDPYKPTQQSSAWSVGDTNKYSGAESTGIAKMLDILKHGGYSPEQKQTMLQGSMQPVYQQAEESKRQAERSTSERGLRYSGVLDRYVGDIDKQTMSTMGQLSGEIERSGADKVMDAFKAVQEGSMSMLEMKQKNDQFNADLGQQHQELEAQLNMHAGDLQLAIEQINATLQMTANEQNIALTGIMNNYNLTEAEMAAVQEQAQNEMWANFAANIIGSILSAGGAIAGAKK